MKFVFRTDASMRIGSGHVMRCLTFAEELKKYGAEITFITRAHEGNLNGLISRKGIEVAELPPTGTRSMLVGERGNDDYADWLGVSKEQDAVESIKMLLKTSPEWLIVDHYGLDKVWEKALRSHVKKIMVIDDLANRRHDCGMLLDQNYLPEGDDRYQGKIPFKSIVLLGPKYALLRPEYKHTRQHHEGEHNGSINRALIYFGSMAPKKLTMMTLNAFNHSDLRSVSVDVVIGANDSHEKDIKEYCKLRANVRCHTLLPHLADLMAKADISIGAGGTTTWERFCLGLPSIVITTGENQEPATKALAKDGYLTYLGTSEQITTEKIIDAMKSLIDSPETLKQQANAGKELVDGKGVERVIKQLSK